MEMNTQSHASELLDPKQAANHLGLKNPNTLAVWRSTGRYNLPYIRVGGNVRYRLSDLNAWLESRRRESGATA